MRASCRSRDRAELLPPPPPHHHTPPPAHHPARPPQLFLRPRGDHADGDGLSELGDDDLSVGCVFQALAGATRVAWAGGGRRAPIASEMPALLVLVGVLGAGGRRSRLISRQIVYGIREGPVVPDHILNDRGSPGHSRLFWHPDEFRGLGIRAMICWSIDACIA